jgi:hypothetical protein
VDCTGLCALQSSDELRSNRHSSTFLLYQHLPTLQSTYAVCLIARQLPPLICLDVPPCGCLPRLHDADARGSSRLPVNARPALQSLPLPRGPAQQSTLRPLKEGLCLQVLGLHGYAHCARNRRNPLTRTATGFGLPFGVAGKHNSRLLLRARTSNTNIPVWQTKKNK